MSKGGKQQLQIKSAKIRMICYTHVAPAHTQYMVYSARVCVSIYIYISREREREREGCVFVSGAISKRGHAH